MAEFLQLEILKVLKDYSNAIVIIAGSQVPRKKTIVANTEGLATNKWYDNQ